MSAKQQKSNRSSPKSLESWIWDAACSIRGHRGRHRLGKEHADTFRNVQHPFNDSDWFRKDDDARWQFGVPPKGNANFAWVQHFIHHLAPQGMAGFVLANGSMSSNQSGEDDIRQTILPTFLSKN